MSFMVVDNAKSFFVSYLISIVDVVVGVVTKRISKFRAEWL